jgi:hypothetical protein
MLMLRRTTSNSIDAVTVCGARPCLGTTISIRVTRVVLVVRSAKLTEEQIWLNFNWRFYLHFQAWSARRPQLKIAHVHLEAGLHCCRC